MRLNYFPGKNFGDALNPIIFEKLLPGFFDEDPSADFFGIGSIIGFPMMLQATKKIIFSSGFTSAYGSLPKIDNSYDIFAVRGPLTAQALKIDSRLAVTDGAALLREFNFPRPAKKYACSFMPHWESELKYPWKKLCEEAGLHYVSPTEEPMKVIDELLKSEVVVAEAMHFAIVADVLRVPWIPVKAYQGINDFKWNDWAQSLQMKYAPHSIRSMYEDNKFVAEVFRGKTKNRYPDAAYKLITKSYVTYQNLFLKSGVVKQLQEASRFAPQLSQDSVFNAKTDQLVETLQQLQKKYAPIVSRSA